MLREQLAASNVTVGLKVPKVNFIQHRPAGSDETSEDEMKRRDIEIVLEMCSGR